MTRALSIPADNCPDIERGDVLRIRPDAGRLYDATVINVLDDGRARCRAEATDMYGRPVKSTHLYSAEEIAGWHVRGDLSINPPEQRPRRA